MRLGRDGQRRLGGLGRAAALATGLCALAPAAAAAQDAAQDAMVARGAEIAAELCAGCHAVGAGDESPLAEAPAFRTLGERYPVSHLQEALAEGIVTGHPEMPEVALPPEDVAAFIAYLESLQPERE